MQSRFDDGLDLIFLCALPTDLARRFMFQTGHSAFQEVIAPENDGRPTGIEILSDPPIGKSLMRQQTNVRSQHNFLGSRRGSNPILKLAFLFYRHWKGIRWLPHALKIALTSLL